MSSLVLLNLAFVTDTRQTIHCTHLRQMARVQRPEEVRSGANVMLHKLKLNIMQTVYCPLSSA